MRIKKGIVIEKMGESFVAYDNESSTLHELNQTAYMILCDLEKGFSKASTINKLVKEFGVDKRSAEKDYASFILDLKKKDLIDLKKK